MVLLELPLIRLESKTVYQKWCDFENVRIFSAVPVDEFRHKPKTKIQCQWHGNQISADKSRARTCTRLFVYHRINRMMESVCVKNTSIQSFECRFHFCPQNWGHINIVCVALSATDILPRLRLSRARRVCQFKHSAKKSTHAALNHSYVRVQMIIIIETITAICHVHNRL